MKFFVFPVVPFYFLPDIHEVLLFPCNMGALDRVSSVSSLCGILAVRAGITLVSDQGGHFMPKILEMMGTWGKLMGNLIKISYF